MKLRNKKTGYVGDFNIECIKERGGYVKVVANDVPYYEIKKECGNLYYYDTLVEFNEEWEDYTSTEPLIKDEKVRKAVRAWADANGIERVWHECASCWLRGNGLSIEMENEVDELEQGNYTITELCGEEEE